MELNWFFTSSISYISQKEPWGVSFMIQRVIVSALLLACSWREIIYVLFSLTANTNSYWANRNISGKMCLHKRMLFCHNINILCNSLLWKHSKVSFFCFSGEQNSKLKVCCKTEKPALLRSFCCCAFLFVISPNPFTVCPFWIAEGWRQSGAFSTDT